MAASDPDLLVVGIDANADNLRHASRRAAGPQARGGLPNVVFGRLALEGAPGALGGLADRVTVLLPWGSLLGAVAGAEPDGLARLRGLCAPGAAIEVVVSEGDLGGRSPEDLRAGYATAGLEVGIREGGTAEVAALGTTWAKRLARSDPGRRFRRLSGVAVERPAAATPGTAPRRGS